jgi:hypothetical protein
MTRNRRDQRDLDAELRAIRDADRALKEERATPVFSDPEAPTRPVHVHVHAPKKSSKPPEPSNQWVKALISNDWLKLLAALILGGAGGEFHQVVRKTGTQEPPSREDITALNKEIGRLKRAATTAASSQVRTKQQLYDLGRFTYGVLPKQGVQVYLDEGVPEPDPMEFHPAPLVRKVGPKDPKPIQPKQSFPMPDGP